MSENNSILILGESGVGKTHFGAQLLMRLQQNLCKLSMDGAASNLEPFADAMDRLYDGMTAKHTPSATYSESVWPIKDINGDKGNLIWPDYAGEQVFNISKVHNVPKDWHQRITESSAWIFMVRPYLYRLSDDVLSKPLTDSSTLIANTKGEGLSDQSRLIELLQIFLFFYKNTNRISNTPKTCFLISCWDELNTDLSPSEFLMEQLPMLYEFIHSKWEKPLILGLSALGKSLDQSKEDSEYLSSEPGKFGYIVQADGKKDSDLTLPIQHLIS